MPKSTDESNVYTKLRQKAEAHLLSGTTLTASHWSMGVDALQLLHRLSGDPDKADDALKVLHELQVHQMELDLQNEEIAANEQALMEDIQLYRTLYDRAPVSYLVVDLQGDVIQGNFAAAELFGVDLDDLEGQRIDTFLSPQSRPQLLGLMERVAQSGATDSCLVERGGDVQGSRHLHFMASMPTGRGPILLVCCECGNVE